MGQFTQIIFAIKLKHRYNNVFKRNYGSSYEIRQKNFIRRGLTQMPGAILHPLWEERSKQKFVNFLTKSGAKNGLRNHMYLYCEKV